MIDRRFFDSLMSERRMSMRSLAKKLDMNHSQLSLTFSGARRLQLDEAAKLADVLGVTLQQIALAIGVSAPSSRNARCQVIGALVGNGTVEIYPPQIVERTSCPEGLPENVVAIQARTADSPLSWIDSWVFFLQRPVGIAPDSVGRFCYATLADGRSVLATIRRGYREGTFNLSGPVNEASAGLLSCTPIIMTRN